LKHVVGRKAVVVWLADFEEFDQGGLAWCDLAHWSWPISPKQRAVAGHGHDEWLRGSYPGTLKYVVGRKAVVVRLAGFEESGQGGHRGVLPRASTVPCLALQTAHCWTRAR